MASLMGDYIIDQTLTPNRGPYASFTRSTGTLTLDTFFSFGFWRNDDVYVGLVGIFPLNSSSQGDIHFTPNTIEPDKGGIAGYALLLLYNETNNQKYIH